MYVFGEGKGRTLQHKERKMTMEDKRGHYFEKRTCTFKFHFLQTQCARVAVFGKQSRWIAKQKYCGETGNGCRR